MQESHPSVQHLPHGPFHQQEPGTQPVPAHPAPRIPGGQEATLLTPCHLPTPQVPSTAAPAKPQLKFGFWQGGSVPEQLFPPLGKKQVTGQKPFASPILIYHRTDHTGQEYSSFKNVLDAL